ncbi:MAG TPA: hypothetical protein VMV71_04150 [Candidatus Paceibacterota bacterium]|nr:hypothetical protein [Candidatus Paceibacterota bacterium]
MKTNTEFFDYSLKNPELLVDDFYIKEKGLIISDSPSKPNQLMKINREMLDNITAYRIAIGKGNDKMQRDILKTVQSLLRNKGLNFSEFASFWAVVDVSYSLYLSLTDVEQLEFLDSVIRKYLEMRHETYIGHGYSATTLQVGKDAKAHKSSGSLGIIKTDSMLVKNGYSQLTELTIEAFKDNDKIFLFSDKKGKRLFKEILKTFKIKFLWSLGRQNKMPDVLFKNGNDIYIVEHKHMKEGGGGQDKQVAEVIDFIGYSEKGLSVSVHYITFMDGLYFNLFTRQTDRDGKLNAQIANIRGNLKANQENYFVNTAGFGELLNQIG